MGFNSAFKGLSSDPTWNEAVFYESRS